MKSFAEPVLPSTLVIGEVYFSLTFLDDETLVPVLEPLVFIGKNLVADEVDQYHFQDAESYRDGVRYGPGAADEGAIFFTGSTKAVFAYERALDLLLGCSLRRRERGLS